MLAEREREMKAAAPSGPVLLPERRVTQSTALQDLGPLSGLVRNRKLLAVPTSRGLAHPRMFFLLWNAKPWIPKITQAYICLNVA